MQPDSQGMCNSYYGTWDIKYKSRQGIYLYMLDEHVIKTVDRERKKVHKDLEAMMKVFNKSINSMLRKSDDEIKIVRELMADITKFMYRMIDLNGLKTPDIEKVERKKKTKPKVAQEDSYDGYL